MKYSLIGVGLLATMSLSAQETPRVAFNVGGGFTRPLGSTGRQLDNGWNVAGGIGVNWNQWFGTMIDAGYNRFGINSTTLKNVGFPGGDVGIFSATLDPVIHLTPRSYADIYLIGGAGLYRVNQEFTQPGVAPVVGFDPFFGFYQALVPTTQVLSSYSRNKPGVNAGVGFAVGTKWHGKLYAEARWNRVFIGNDRYADYIPVTFGFRF